MQVFSKKNNDEFTTLITQLLANLYQNCVILADNFIYLHGYHIHDHIPSIQPSDQTGVTPGRQKTHDQNICVSRLNIMQSENM